MFTFICSTSSVYGAFAFYVQIEMLIIALSKNAIYTFKPHLLCELLMNGRTGIKKFAMTFRTSTLFSFEMQVVTLK